MYTRVRQFLAIARLTAMEAGRQPISLLLFSACLLAIALFPFVITHALEEGDKLVRDSALSIHFLAGLFLGAYSACAAFRREILRGTAAAVLSKPVSRTAFFLAKFAGISVFMLCFCLAATVATLTSARTAQTASVFWTTDWWAAMPMLAAVPAAAACAGVMNYFFKKPFTSTAFHYLMFSVLLAAVIASTVDPMGRLAWPPLALPLVALPVSALVSLAVLVLAALATSLATRLNTVPTLTICALAFLLGLVSDYAFGRPAAHGNSMAGLIYHLVPNWQHFWTADLLSRQGFIGADHLHAAGLYGALYLAGILCLGALSFRTMEIK